MSGVEGNKPVSRRDVLKFMALSATLLVLPGCDGDDIWPKLIQSQNFDGNDLTETESRSSNSNIEMMLSLVDLYSREKELFLGSGVDGINLVNSAINESDKTLADPESDINNKTYAFLLKTKTLDLLLNFFKSQGDQNTTLVNLLTFEQWLSFNSDQFAQIDEHVASLSLNSELLSQWDYCKQRQNSIDIETAQVSNNISDLITSLNTIITTEERAAYAIDNIRLGYVESASSFNLGTANLQLEFGTIFSNEFRNRLIEYLTNTISDPWISLAGKDNIFDVDLTEQLFRQFYQIHQKRVGRTTDLASYSVDEVKQWLENPGGFKNFVHREALDFVDKMIKDSVWLLAPKKIRLTYIQSNNELRSVIVSFDPKLGQRLDDLIENFCIKNEIELSRIQEIKATEEHFKPNVPNYFRGIIGSFSERHDTFSQNRMVPVGFAYLMSKKRDGGYKFDQVVLCRDINNSNNKCLSWNGGRVDINEGHGQIQLSSFDNNISRKLKDRVLVNLPSGLYGAYGDVPSLQTMVKRYLLGIGRSYGLTDEFFENDLTELIIRMASVNTGINLDYKGVVMAGINTNNLVNPDDRLIDNSKIDVYMRTKTLVDRLGMFLGHRPQIVKSGHSIEVGEIMPVYGGEVRDGFLEIGKLRLSILDSKLLDGIRKVLPNFDPKSTEVSLVVSLDQVDYHKAGKINLSTPAYFALVLGGPLAVKALIASSGAGGTMGLAIYFLSKYLPMEFAARQLVKSIDDGLSNKN